jgi:signal transduction histidine kinase
LPLGDLLALGTQIRSDITPEALFREVAETVHRVMRSPWVYVRLRNPDTDVLEAVAYAGINADLQAKLRVTTVSPSFYQTLFQPRFRISDSFLIPIEQSVSYEPEELTQALRASIPSADTLLVLLRGRGDRLLGVIYVSAPTDPQAFELPNIQVLEAIARQSALALENVRLADRSARLLAKEQLLAELGRDVGATLDLAAILSRTIARLKVAFQNGSVALINANGELELAAAVVPLDETLRAVRIKLGEGVIGRVAQQGGSFFSNEVTAESDGSGGAPYPFECLAFFNAKSLVYSCLAAPLWSGGQVIGTLNVGNDQPGAFSYEDVDLLEAIAAQVGGPITSARLYQESQRLAAQVQRRAEQLTVLNALARAATATLDMEPVLVEVTNQIQQGFGYNHVELFLLDEETHELILSAHAGEQLTSSLGYRQHVSRGLLGRTARTGKTQQADDVCLDPEYVLMTNRASTRSELCVPIVASGRVLGVLNVESQAVGAFTSEDVAVLETAADVLAGAIENARLYQRAQAAAVLEERNRLARELHDSVTQQLFSITLTAQAARTHLEKNPARAAVQIERLQETATAALAEMRALISQLRPPALREQGLVAALQQHAAMISHREGFRVELSVTGDERYARGLEQPLYRIVQEALNNVIKHANATLVQIMLEFSAERVWVRVIDDGQGFDASAPPSESGRRLGLIGMRERAAEINGTMELRSAIGGGSEVIVTVVRS